MHLAATKSPALMLHTARPNSHSELTLDEKVAGLSKIWSEAHFNFPFFGRLADTDWDRLYVDYLPQVR